MTFGPPTPLQSMMLLGAGSSGGGEVALDLSGLNVLASYNFADASAVWADQSRTVAPTEGGRVIGLTDLSGNGNHGYFTGIGGLWRNGTVEQPKESLGTNYAAPEYTSTVVIPDLEWNSRDIAFHWLWEPLSRYGSFNPNGWMMADTAYSYVILQHDLTNVQGDDGRWILPGFSGPWNNTLPWASERQAFSFRLKTNEAKMFQNGTGQAQAGTMGNYTLTGLHIGGGVSPTFGQAHHGYIARRLIITDSASASDARIEQLHTDLKAQWTGVAATKSLNWLVTGDSLTAGDGADSLPYWRQLAQTNTAIRMWPNGVGGTAAAGAALAGLNILRSKETSMPTMDHVVLWIGFNDCKNGYAAADIQTAISDWVTSYAGSSYTIFTIAPEFYLTGANLTTKETVNTWIRSTYGSNVLDLDTVGLVANGSSGDFAVIPGYGSDTVHLSAQGHYKVAAALATKLGLSAPAAL